MYRRIAEKERKIEVISFRISVEEKEALQHSADSNKMTLPDYVSHLLAVGINK